MIYIDLLMGGYKLMKRITLYFIPIIVFLFILNFFGNQVSAEKITSQKWGKVTLKSGHIGKVIINKDIRIYKLDKKTNKITKFKIAKKKQEYAVYSKKSVPHHGIMLGIGSGHYIKYKNNQVTFKTVPKSLIEVIGKERVWLYDEGLTVENSKGDYVDLPNLQEAIIISKQKDKLLSDDVSTYYNVKLRVKNKYYTLDSVEDYHLEYNYLTKNPFKKYKYSKATWDLIKKQKIKIGMSKNQVRLSWGVPDDTNDSGGSWGTYDQWVYGDPIYGAQYVYFSNGKLESWQND
jgi:hypothetical protein